MQTMSSWIHQQRTFAPNSFAGANHTATAFSRTHSLHLPFGKDGAVASQMKEKKRIKKINKRTESSSGASSLVSAHGIFLYIMYYTRSVWNTRRKHFRIFQWWRDRYSRAIDMHTQAIEYVSGGKQKRACNAWIHHFRFRLRYAIFRIKEGLFSLSKDDVLCIVAGIEEDGHTPARTPTHQPQSPRMLSNKSARKHDANEESRNLI